MCLLPFLQLFLCGSVPFTLVYLFYVLSLFTPSTVSNLHLHVYMYIPPMSLFFSFRFLLSFPPSLSSLRRCSRGAPQGWAKFTDKQSTHGDPGHPSQNKQQEDVYLCPFHWPWPLIPVRGSALSVATTLPLSHSSGTVPLLKTCSKRSLHTEIHILYLRIRCLACIISILHSQILWCCNHGNWHTPIFSECQNSKFNTVLSRRLFHVYMYL